MVKLSKIKVFLDKELKIRKIKDYSKNGLQVKCKEEVKKIGFAVDGCLSTFEKAKKNKVDLLVVHHGIKWKTQKCKELDKKREQFLKKNNISLYAAHLPLDLHSQYGNGIELCRILGLVKTKKFGKYHGIKVGYKGEFVSGIGINKIANILNKSLKTKCDVFPFGKKKIKSIGIVSGGGSDAMEEAVKDKLDCFLVGEINLGAYNRAKDYKMNMVAAGHYATETGGVKALLRLLKQKFNIETIFIDNQTGV